MTIFSFSKIRRVGLHWGGLQRLVYAKSWGWRVGLESGKGPSDKSRGPLVLPTRSNTCTWFALLKHQGSAGLRCAECSRPRPGPSCQVGQEHGLPVSPSLPREPRLGDCSPDYSRAKKTPKPWQLLIEASERPVFES